MLTNLRGIYFKEQRWEKALAILDWMLVLAPDDPTLVRDRGLARGHRKLYAQAMADLEEYLRRDPGAPDAAAVREKLAGLAHARAQVN